MFYREAGQYKTSYDADQAVFPIRQDRIGIAVIVADRLRHRAARRQRLRAQRDADPVPGSALAAIGLNMLTGYTGLLSLGTGAFMGVGAYACYKLTTFFPGVNIILLILLSGFLPPRSARCSACRRCASRASISRSRRSPRSSSCSGASSASPGSTTTTSPVRSKCRRARCSDCRSPARVRRRRRAISSCWPSCVVTWFASNLVRGRIGRIWMAVRDMDIAAELMGIRLYRPSCSPSRSPPSIAASRARMLVFLWLARPKPTLSRSTSPS